MAKRVPETEDDFIRMQQEAIRRVRDMQERARRTLENAGVPLESPAPAPNPVQAPDPQPVMPDQQPFPQYTATPSRSVNRLPDTRPPAVRMPQARAPEPREPIHPAVAQVRPPEPVVPSLNSILNISLDNDQILLLLLIFVLYRDGADKFLILSLVFVFLT